MADERTCYAGDLTTDALGKRVRVTSTSGVTVEDELVDIRYWLDEHSKTSDPVVWLKFKNCAPNQWSYGMEGSGFFTVRHVSTASVGQRVVGSTPEGQTP